MSDIDTTELEKWLNSQEGKSTLETAIRTSQELIKALDEKRRFKDLSIIHREFTI